MKHLCNCGEIVDADGDFMKIATCPNCGMYYIYANEIVHPHNESDNKLLKEIQSKVHSHKEVVDELLLDDEVTPFIYGSEETIVDDEAPVKVKPRPAKRR